MLVTSYTDSHVNCGYTLPTFFQGFKRDLEESDLTETLTEHKSARLGNEIEKYWKDEETRAAKKNRKPSLGRVLVRSFGWEFMFYGLVLFISEVIRMAQPIFLGQLLQFYMPTEQKITQEQAYWYAAGVVLCSLSNILISHPYMMGVLHLGMKLRVACCSLIYRKSLKLSKTALGQTTVGQAKMPRNRERKTTIGLHTEQQMQNALRLISDGQKIRAVARTTHIPYTTLNRYLNKIRNNHDPDRIIRLTPNYAVRKIFTDAQEKSIVDYVIKCSQMFYGLTIMDVRRLIYEVGVLNNIKVPEKWHETKLAEDSFEEEDEYETVDCKDFTVLESLPKEGSFVIVEFEVKGKKIYYAAKVIGEKEHEAEVSFLRKSAKTLNTFFMPNVLDIAMVALKDIKMILPQPKLSGNTKRKQGMYHFNLDFSNINLR
ncbi:unnamed protein product [Ceutorhynchus assimilis]|uniref:ABC transmembrane type-1 domain-containing protein n=1 Tax=Ceutorhynchus assimilis TaxID=467358 RepID=A0A9N9MTQ7_9CUCU|nr:unnamed protein product [Ceutorhynchus assimilis]